MVRRRDELALQLGGFVARVNGHRGGVAKFGHHEIGGVVEAVPVSLGQQVTKGQVLAVISSASVSDQRAELQSTQKRLQLARTTYEREKQLFEQRISPQQDVQQAEQAMREAEIAVSKEIFKRTSEIYRRIRNTARILLANLNGFDPTVHAVAPADLLPLDQWVVNRTAELQQQITAAYERYDFATVVQLLANFCSVDLGSQYVDITKDRLYTLQENAPGRRSAQTAMLHVIEAMVRWMAPILSFTADEIWGYLPGTREEELWFATWYDTPQTQLSAPRLDANDFERLFDLREQVSKVLEPMRANGEIGAALDAEITLRVNVADANWLAPMIDELRFFFISGDVRIEPAGDVQDGIEILAAKTDKPKCVRCWQHRADVGTVAAYAGLCVRCVDNVAGDGEQRDWF